MISKMSQEELKNLPLSDLKSALNSKKQVLKATLENPKNAHLLGKLPPERLAEIRALVGLKDTQLEEQLLEFQESNQPQKATMPTSGNSDSRKLTYRPSLLKASLLKHPEVLKKAKEHPELVDRLPPMMQRMFREAQAEHWPIMSPEELEKKLMDQMKHLPKESQLKIMDAIIMKLGKAQKLLQG